MKKVTITVDVDGNELTREYKEDLTVMDGVVWGVRIIDMLDTLSKANEEKF